MGEAVDTRQVGRIERWTTLDRMPPTWLLLGAMLSFQVGGAVGVLLLPGLGAAGTVFAKNLIGGAVLFAVGRPAVRGRSRAALGWVAFMAVLLTVMNVAFYIAAARIPIGVAVTISFIGPLTVALVLSRHPRDLAWVGLAAAGVALFGGVPGGAALNKVGLACAAIDAVAWAVYAVTARRVSSVLPGSSALAFGMLGSALLLVPFVPAGLQPSHVTPRYALLIPVIGALTALPFALEFAALRRMAAATYGVLVSLEPAISLGVGLLVLSQRPSAVELVAVALVVTASIGAARSAGAAVAGDVGATPEP
jgi:inner membrane transporter RhtA